MEDSYEIFEDHMRTLASFLEVNGYENTNPSYEDLDQEEFFDTLRDTFMNNKELSSSVIDVIGEVKDYRFLMSGIFNHKTEPNKRIFAYFCSTINANMTTSVQEFLRILCNIENCKNAIFITDRDLSSTAKKELNNVEEFCTDTRSMYNIRLFTDKTFVDLANSNFVPKVIKVYNKQETEQFCRDNRVKETKLLRIIVDDALCAFYMASVGNIIELERDTGIESNILKTQRVFRYVTNIPYQRKGAKR